MHLALGLAAAERDDGAAQPLGAVVGAQAAGEQAVAVGDMHLVAGPAAGGVDGARHQLRPHVDVVPGVADHGRLAGGAAGGVHAHHLLARHGEHAERIGVAQVLLGGEGELRQVGEGFQVVRLYAGLVELAPVVGDVVVGMLERPAQAGQLQGGDFVAAGVLDGVKPGVFGHGGKLRVAERVANYPLLSGMPPDSRNGLGGGTAGARTPPVLV